MSKGSHGAPRSVEALQRCLDAETAGVSLYAHLSFRIFGPQLQPIVAFLRAQAAESLVHALTVGDRIVMLGAVPRASAAEPLSREPTTLDEVLRISLVHERAAIDGYRRVMEAAATEGNIPLEDWARMMLSTETDHSSELEKMLRPMG